MKALRILLLVSMTFVVLLMAGCPTLYDSSRRFSARGHYYTAKRQYEFEPSVETQRQFERARLEVEEAKRLDRQHIVIFEMFMLSILGISVYSFIRAGKHIHKSSEA